MYQRIDLVSNRVYVYDSLVLAYMENNISSIDVQDLNT